MFWDVKGVSPMDKLDKKFAFPRLVHLFLIFGMLASIAAAGVFQPSVVRAATYTVCATGCDFTTIGAAVTAAAAGDTINVQSGSYTETNIQVNKNLTITGAGATSTIVQAATDEGIASGRVFTIDPGVTVTIENMLVRNGNVTTVPAHGGGIYNAGTLTLNNVTVSGNRATGPNLGADGGEAFGGGIYNADTGTLTLNNSTVSGNTATGGDTDGSEAPGSGGQGNGGGVYNEGTLSVLNSSVNDNRAVGGDANGATGPNPHGWGKGAGIYTTGTGQITLTDCTVSGNIADGGTHGEGDSRGGGIYNNTNPMTIERCTISGNEVINGVDYQEGGGIANFTGATLTGMNCTISGNSARDGGGIFNFSGPQNPADTSLVLNNCTITNNDASDTGGGLLNLSATQVADTFMENTILAGNSAGTDADCSEIMGEGSGTVTSNGYNLVQVPGTCSFAATGDITGQNPELDSLGLNGGSTTTHALLENSPALDTGNNVTCATTDQREVTRPRPEGGTCDIGAYEARRFSLDVATAGAGVCTVTSTPTGINCGDGNTDCTENYFEIPTVVVNLTVTPATGSVFTSWSGDCTGTNASVSVTMDQNRSCTATCDLEPTQPPIAEDDTATTPQETPVDIPVLDNDTAQTGTLNPTSVTVTGGPTNGTATPNADGTVTYTPATGFTGQDTFTYQVCDTQDTPECASATVTVTVTPVTTGPDAVDDQATTNEDTPVVIRVLDNDTGTAISLTSIGTPSNGTVVNNGDGTVTYTPAPDYNGNDNFPYTITDNNGQTDTATVQVVITPVNDAPTFTPGNDVVVPQGNTCPGDVWATGMSPGPDNESYQSVEFDVNVTDTTGGLSFSLQPAIDATSGMLSCTATPDTYGSSTISLVLRDSEGGTSTSATFTITFQNPNAITLMRFTTVRTTQGIDVQWVTGSEINTSGFHLLRSSNGRLSSASRVTPSLIAARGNRITGASYSWLDTGVQPGETYTYWLQEVELDGTTHTYSGSATAAPAADNHVVFLPLISR